MSRRALGRRTHTAGMLWIALAWSVAAAGPLAGQSGPIKASAAGDRPAAGPASLNAVMARYGAVLQFTPVPNAIGYKVTRVNHAGSPETIVYEGPWTSFRIESHACAAGAERPGCIFVDTHFRTIATNLAVTYRIYGIHNGPAGRSYTLSSPPASVVWHCPDCPRLP